MDKISFNLIKENYSLYTNSLHWKDKRNKIILERKKCELCGVPTNEGKIFILHHLTYENILEDKEEDLQLLCLDCHKAVHEIIKETDPLFAIVIYEENYIKSTFENWEEIIEEKNRRWRKREEEIIFSEEPYILKKAVKEKTIKKVSKNSKVVVPKDFKTKNKKIKIPKDKRYMNRDIEIEDAIKESLLAKLEKMGDFAIGEKPSRTQRRKEIKKEIERLKQRRELEEEMKEWENKNL